MKDDIFIEARRIKYEYIRRDEEGNPERILSALKGMDLKIPKGKIISITGRNGSGKSTLAKLLAAIAVPSEGVIYIDKYDSADRTNKKRIRSLLGVLFQNPDNQLIGQTVEEDVVFGPENHGIMRETMKKLVSHALKKTGLLDFRNRNTLELSGGQKQKTAIAALLAMKPKCLILDEATAMLDPREKKEVFDSIVELNKSENTTIIMITHFYDEIMASDYVYVIDKGVIALEGRPEKIYSDSHTLEKYGLEFPGKNRDSGFAPEKNVEDIQGKIRKAKKTKSSSEEIRKPERPAILFEKVSFSYNKKNWVNDINNVSLNIKKGEFAALTGESGAGKTTLLQLMDGILKPEEGDIYIDGENLNNTDLSRKEICRKIGLVFQYPEQQFFEKTVFEEVSFAPKMLGISKKEAELSTFAMLRKMKISEDLFYSSPFELSGGEKRRVALAGLLVTKTDIILLDEPTAGLDMENRKLLFSILKELQQSGKTIVMITHSMDEVENYAEHVIELKNGQISFDGAKEEYLKI